MIDNLVEKTEARMSKSLESLAKSLKRLRTGRAHPALIDHLFIDYYGTKTPISQMATITTEDARTLNISVWDKSALKIVEKAILEGNLGLTPKVIGTNLKIPVPAMTQERRKELIKQLKNEAEQAKVAVRNIRRELLALIKEEQKSKNITEDDERKNSEIVQKITDKNINNIDEMIKSKESEILDI
tara:strand:- start:364 stop:921 length:558 start_codon:yes stop_codon:yes gene_type:complete